MFQSPFSENINPANQRGLRGASTAGSNESFRRTVNQIYCNTDHKTFREGQMLDKKTPNY